MKSTFVQLAALVMAVSSLQIASAAPAATENSLESRWSCGSGYYKYHNKCHRKKSTGEKCMRDSHCKSDHCSKAGKCAAHPRGYHPHPAVGSSTTSSGASTTTSAATSSSSSTTATTTTTSATTAPSAPMSLNNYQAVSAYAIANLASFQQVGDPQDYQYSSTGNPNGPLAWGAGPVSVANFQNTFFGYQAADQDALTGNGNTVSGPWGSSATLNYIKTNSAYGSPAGFQVQPTNEMAKRQTSTTASGKYIYYDYFVSNTYTTGAGNCVIVPSVNQQTLPFTVITPGNNATGNAAYTSIGQPTTGMPAGTLEVPVAAGTQINSIALQLICAQGTTATVYFSNAYIERRTQNPAGVYTLQDQYFTQNPQTVWASNNTADTFTSPNNNGGAVLNWPFVAYTGAPNAADIFNQTFGFDTNLGHYQSGTTGGASQKYVLTFNGASIVTSGTVASNTADKCTIQTTANGIVMDPQSAGTSFSGLTASSGASTSNTITYSVDHTIFNSFVDPNPPEIYVSFSCVFASSSTTAQLKMGSLSWGPSNT